MPVLFTPPAARNRRRRSSRRNGASIVSRRPNAAILILSWAAALTAIIAVFLGGAGLIMIGAGHHTAATFGLAGLGAGAAVYLTWFLSVGPGREPDKASPVWTPRTTSLVPAVDRPVALEPTPVRRLRCWFCGGVEDADNRLIWGDRAAICQRCVATAERAAASFVGQPAPGPGPAFARFDRLREVAQRNTAAVSGAADALPPDLVEESTGSVRRAG